MKSRTTEQFRAAFARLPGEVQEHARRAFKTWRQEPFRSSLQFKPLAIMPPAPAELASAER